MLAEEVAPTEIGKHANIIKAAQEDLIEMDVLVCGRCLQVFHFVEEYQQHKRQPCEKDCKSLRESSDTKPSIWAFLLWKATQLNSKNELNTTSSWGLYQMWVKLEESVRETWIVAGKTIQSFGKLGQGDLQEMPVRITKTVVNNSNTSESSPTRKPLAQAKSQATNLKDTDTEPATKKSASPLPVVSKPGNKRAKRSVPNSNEKVEENVEKIVAKRYNPRRKTHEYLVKWEGRVHSQNTWEPAAHLQDVTYYLDIFEKQLARQKETKAVLNAKNSSTGGKLTEDAVRGAAAKKISAQSNADSTGSPGRPPRTSKTKAMDQVKQWVSESANAGSTSPSSTAEEETVENDWPMNTISSPSAGIKRKFHDPELNDSNASDSALGGTASTLDELDEDLIPSHTVKRLKNGSSISVEVKTKTDKNVEKVVKVNGTASGRTSAVGECLPVAPNSAEVIITQDSSATGVVRKPGATANSTKPEKPEATIRILSKAESLVSNTGIIRVSNTNSNEEPLMSPKLAHSPVSRVQQLRSGTGVVGTQGRQTPTSTTVASAGPRHHVVHTRTPSGTLVQRRTISPAVGSAKPGVLNPGNRLPTTVRAGAQTTAASGRMILPRTGAANTTTPNNARSLPMASKNVTPEEKIFNLSKSGDLKVTKKVMTREELRAAQQQRLQQQQRQPQSQVQIQKVQQIAPPRQRVIGAGATTSTRSAVAAVAPQLTAEQPQEDEEHHAQLCPITGKLIGQEETQLRMEQEQQAEQQQEQQQQQQLQTLEQAIMSGEQQMLTNEDGTPLLVRGEDGTVYQVAGKNSDGHTILVTQGPDGEQQYAYVAASENDENQVLTLDNAVAEAVAQLPAEQQAEALTAAAAAAGEGGQYLVTMSEDELAATATTQLTIQTGDGSDGADGNIPAEVVQADLPSPGGTRRVVLLLNDGTFMMTEMHDDEFKALNIQTPQLVTTA